MKKLILLFSITAFYFSSYSQNNPITFDPLGGASGDLFGIKVSETGNNTSKLHIYRNFSYDTNDIDRLVIDSGGKIGIGTSSPISNLHIATNENAISWNGVFNNQRNSSTVSGYGSGIKLKLSHNGEGWKWGGIALIQEGPWANNSGLALYADGAEYARINTVGNFGIGTTTPSAKLDVNGGNIYMNSGLVQFNRTYENYANVLSIRTRDNNQHGDFRFETEKTDDNTIRTIAFLDGGKLALGIGTEIIPSDYKLAVAGKIISEEVKVQLQTAWPDYVFAQNYNLNTLEETESFIKEEGHLPNIPSASEVEENGINLGEMNAKLLEKIEELTLHLIEMKKENVSMKKDIEKLKMQFHK